MIHGPGLYFTDYYRLYNKYNRIMTFPHLVNRIGSGYKNFKSSFQTWKDPKVDLLICDSFCNKTCLLWNLVVKSKVTAILQGSMNKWTSLWLLSQA